MKFKILLLTIVLSFFYISFNQTAFAYDIAACVPYSSCNAAYFGKDASCTNIITSLVSCINPAYSSCEATFLASGSSCETGGKVCSSGICDCPSNKPKWDTISASCVECLTDSDCTNPTKPNCDTPTHTCILKTTPVVCTATLSLSPGTGDPCSVSATISATGCDGKSYQVKEGSTSKCSGTVSGGSASCSFSQSGAKSYDLYVDSSKMDTESATCGTPPITGCSAYNGDAGNCNGAGG